MSRAQHPRHTGRAHCGTHVCVSTHKCPVWRGERLVFAPNLVERTGYRLPPSCTRLVAFRRLQYPPFLPVEYREWERCGHCPWEEQFVQDEFFTVLHKWLAQQLAQRDGGWELAEGKKG